MRDEKMRWVKLPYIDDKKVYAAVAFACSYVWDTGNFEEGTSYYAEKYDADVEEVRKYVRIALDSERRGKSRWFAVEYSVSSEYDAGHFVPEKARYIVKKGLSETSVKDALSKRDNYMNRNAMCHWFGRVSAFDTRQEAWQTAQKWAMEAGGAQKSCLVCGVDSVDDA